MDGLQKKCQWIHMAGNVDEASLCSDSLWEGQEALTGSAVTLVEQQYSNINCTDEV